MDIGKRRSLFKRLTLLVLMASFVLGQYTPAQAAAKRTKDPITLNKTVYTIKKGLSV